MVNFDKHKTSDHILMKLFFLLSSDVAFCCGAPVQETDGGPLGAPSGPYFLPVIGVSGQGAKGMDLHSARTPKALREIGNGRGCVPSQPTKGSRGAS